MRLQAALGVCTGRHARGGVAWHIPDRDALRRSNDGGMTCSSPGNTPIFFTILRIILPSGRSVFGIARRRGASCTVGNTETSAIFHYPTTMCGFHAAIRNGPSVCEAPRRSSEGHKQRSFRAHEMVRLRVGVDSPQTPDFRLGRASRQ